MMVLLVSCLAIFWNPTALNNRAVQRYAEGRWREAELLYQAALSLTPSSEFLRTASISSNLAALYKAEARYAEAEDLYERALRLRQQSPRTPPGEVAASLNNLAEILRLERRYDDAIPHFERALTIFDRLGDQGEIGLVLNNLAEVYRVYRLDGEAERLLREAVTLMEKSFGPEHVRTAVTLANLAHVLEERNNLAGSERLQMQALQIFRKCSGQHDGDIATSLSHLGRVYLRQKRFAEAEQLQLQALRLIGPAETLTRAAILHNLGNAREANGRLADALNTLEQSRSIRERLLGSNHPVIAPLLADYARLLRRMKRKSEAIAIEAQARALTEQERLPRLSSLVVSVETLKSWPEREK